MSKVNLNQIREIEKESDKIIVDAEKKVEEMIKSTNSAAEKIKNDAKANANQQAEELMKNIETETDNEIKSIDSTGEKRKNDLLESKNKNFKDAIKVVVDKVISN
ncbi:MAG: V-type ATPase subunit subunit G family protein [Candidatus Heimdallarchaeota archaeon]